MKKDFDVLYEELKSNNESEIQEVWGEAKKEKRKRNIIFLFIAIIVDIIVLYFIKGCFPIEEMMIDTKFAIMPFIIMLLVIDTFIYVIIYAFLHKKGILLSKIFKEKVVKNVIENFYDDVNYMPTNRMGREIYNEAQYKEYYNEYSSDDYIEAKLENKYNMKMAEVHTVDEETHTDSDGHTTTTRTTIFHGLFAKLELDKSIENRLVIKNDGRILKKERLEMDSQEFEKYFDVSSDNEIIGMQILTHDVMELLVRFRNETKINFDIVINNNLMYLRFHVGSMFELGSIKKGALDEEIIKRYYNILDFTYKLNEELIKVINETEI